MQRRWMVVVVSVCLALSVSLILREGTALADDQAGVPHYEVWAIDQADSTADGGGALYIYDGDSLTGRTTPAAEVEVIDLGADTRALCLERTGSAPRRPHMLVFNAASTHAALAFVATGHVVVFDTASRAPVACIDAGEQAHAAFPSPDEQFILVANQNGKLLQRIRSDYQANTYTLEDAATIDLATCRTPSGAACQDQTLRPDNAPICPVIDATSRWAFVTLRGGGLFVVDLTATPMAIVAEYDRATVGANGCGGVEARGQMYINSGGGTPATPLRSDLYAFPLAGYSSVAAPPNTPAPLVVFQQQGRVDSHGAAQLKDGALLWVADRAANKIVVVDTATNRIVNEIALAGALSADPTPDLIGVAPSGDWAFVTLRGPSPLSGNAPDEHNAVGSTPGVGVIRVSPDGRDGRLLHIAPITRVVDGVERADPHAIAVRPR